MKSTSKNHRKDRPRPAARPSPGLGQRFLLLAALVLLSGAGTWAFLVYVVWNVTPAELVGTWVVMRGPPDQEGGTFEFCRDGTLIGHIGPDGNHHVVRARIRVEGDKIYATTRHSITGEELTRIQTITNLTKKSLVLRDEQGNQLVMERTE
jgi:uncharacterized protein (TIGR03066 family)